MSTLKERMEGNLQQMLHVRVFDEQFIECMNNTLDTLHMSLQNIQCIGTTVCSALFRVPAANPEVILNSQY